MRKFTPLTLEEKIEAAEEQKLAWKECAKYGIILTILLYLLFG